MGCCEYSCILICEAHPSSTIGRIVSYQQLARVIGKYLFPPMRYDLCMNIASSKSIYFVSTGIVIGIEPVIDTGHWSDQLELKLGCNITRESKVISCISAFGALL